MIMLKYYNRFSYNKHTVKNCAICIYVFKVKIYEIYYIIPRYCTKTYKQRYLDNLLTHTT